MTFIYEKLVAIPVIWSIIDIVSMYIEYICQADNRLPDDKILVINPCYSPVLALHENELQIGNIISVNQTKTIQGIVSI